MRRHTLWIAAAAVLSLSIAACNSDNTTAIPAISSQVEGSAGVLRDVITFFTYEFSPSGDVAVMSSDGSGRRPLTGGDRGFEPALSPDGRRIAFSRVTDFGVSAIYVMNVDGTDPTPIVQGLVFNPGPAWSPDGCQIAFRSQREGSTGPTGRISIIYADGTGLRQVSPEPGPNDFAFDEGPTWSPDGTRLAFTRNAVLHVINVDGTGMTPLPNEDMAQSASWSPDGQRIAYMSVNPPGEIHLRNADGSNLVRVTTTPEFFDGWPRWSPDGSRLVFSRFANEQAQLVTISPDGTGAVRLTPEGINDYMPDWSHRPSSSARCDAGIRIDVAPSPLRLGPEETRQLTATVRSTSGTVIDHAMVEWSSTDASVVTVAQAGLVTAVGSGTVLIQARFANATGSAQVTVGN